VALACGESGEVEAAVLEVAGAQIKYINTWSAICNVRVTCRVRESCEITLSIAVYQYHFLNLF
jgi:hypothetical protein